MQIFDGRLRESALAISTALYYNDKIASDTIKKYGQGMKAADGPFPLDSSASVFDLYTYNEFLTNPVYFQGATCTDLNGSTEVTENQVKILKYFWEEGLNQNLGSKHDVNILRIVFFFKSGVKCVYPAQTLKYHFDYYPQFTSGNFQTDVNSKFGSNSVVFERNVLDYMKQDPDSSPRINSYWTKIFSQNDAWQGKMSIQYNADYYTRMMPSMIYSEPYPINIVAAYTDGMEKDPFYFHAVGIPDDYVLDFSEKDKQDIQNHVLNDTQVSQGVPRAIGDMLFFYISSPSMSTQKNNEDSDFEIYTVVVGQNMTHTRETFEENLQIMVTYDLNQFYLLSLVVNFSIATILLIVSCICVQKKIIKPIVKLNDKIKPQSDSQNNLQQQNLQQSNKNFKQGNRQYSSGSEGRASQKNYSRSHRGRQSTINSARPLIKKETVDKNKKNYINEVQELDKQLMTFFIDGQTKFEKANKDSHNLVYMMPEEMSDNPFFLEDQQEVPNSGLIEAINQNRKTDLRQTYGLRDTNKAINGNSITDGDQFDRSTDIRQTNNNLRDTGAAQYGNSIANSEQFNQNDSSNAPVRTKTQHLEMIREDSDDSNEQESQIQIKHNLHIDWNHLARN